MQKRGHEKKTVTFELGQCFSLLVEQLPKYTDVQTTASDSLGFNMCKITSKQPV